MGQPDVKKTTKEQPGDGLRSLKSTSLFRVINFELYARPNMGIMLFGAIAMTGCLSYIAYMKYKYKEMGYYVAIQEDGEQFIKKKSKWD